MSKTVSLKALALSLIMIGEANAQTPIPASPQDFAIAASQSDQYEIMAGRLAEVQGQSPDVRAFAEEMIRDHTKLSEDTRQAVIASKLPPPPLAMSSDQGMLLSGLQALRGADFDWAYVRQQILAHAQAIAISESFADAGADSSLQTTAKSSLPTIQGHLKAAERLLAKLGGI